jgi:hypothetical protein
MPATKSFRGSRSGVASEDVYKAWHREHCARESYVMNIDQLEYRYRDGVMVPVAIIETTHYNAAHDMQNLHANVLARLEQSARPMLVKVAEALGIKAWCVLHDEGITQFYVYNLTDSRGWFGPVRPERLARWLDGL